MSESSISSVDRKLGQYISLLFIVLWTEQTSEIQIKYTIRIRVEALFPVIVIGYHSSILPSYPNGIKWMEKISFGGLPWLFCAVEHAHKVALHKHRIRSVESRWVLQLVYRFVCSNQVQEIPLKKAGGKLLSSIPGAQRVLDILHDGSVFFNRKYFAFYVLDFDVIEHLNQILQKYRFRACLFLSCVPGPVTGEWWVLHHALTHGGKFSAAASAARWLVVTRLTSAELTSDLSTTHSPVLRPSPARQHGPWTVWTLGRGCRPQIWRTEELIYQETCWHTALRSLGESDKNWRNVLSTLGLQ